MKKSLKKVLIGLFALCAPFSGHAGEVSAHFFTKDSTLTVDGEVSAHYSDSLQFIPTSENALRVYERLIMESSDEIDINAEFFDKDSGESEALVFKKAFAGDEKVYLSALRSDGSILVWLMSRD